MPPIVSQDRVFRLAHSGSRAASGSRTRQPDAPHREPSSKAPIGYRPEIDGLRAVAVLPVVLFHADIAGFSGGYLGVDIFFVISGYLIGSIILAELHQERFSLLKFYERRARRLLPALFVVVLVCLPLAWAWLPPADLMDFAQSVVAVTLFGSNHLFWYESGYFDTGAELKPLLHTWSLAIEGQFYAFVPIVFLLIWRFWRRGLGLLLIAGFVASLAIAEHVSRNDPSTSFFLLPYRGWELLGGLILAHIEHSRGFPAAGRMGGLLAMAGLMVIGLSIALFDANTTHPGVYTLLPVAGTALVIAFGACRGWANRLLTARLVVGLGLISYSLYLWHHPLFAFADHRSLDGLTPYDYAVLIAVSVVAAALTCRYIEMPFRRRERISLGALVPTMSAAAVGLVAFGLYGHFHEGVKARYAPPIQALLETEQSSGNLQLVVDGEQCFNRNLEDACLLGDASQPVTWALVGDSHAGALGLAFDGALNRIGAAGLSMTKGGCAFALGMRRHDRGTECLEFSEAALARLLDSGIDRVILMARYSLYLTNDRFDNGEGGVGRGPTPQYGPPNFRTETERRRALARSYVESVQRLLDAGIKVVLVYPVPEVGWDVPVRLAKLALRGRDEAVSTSYARYKAYAGGVFELFDSLGMHPNLVRIYPNEMLCDRQLEKRCIVQDGDVILYSDDNHLTLEGARRLTERIFSKACARWGCKGIPEPKQELERTADSIKTNDSSS